MTAMLVSVVGIAAFMLVIYGILWLIETGRKPVPPPTHCLNCREPLGLDAPGAYCSEACSRDDYYASQW